MRFLLFRSRRSLAGKLRYRSRRTNGGNNSPCFSWNRKRITNDYGTIVCYYCCYKIKRFFRKQNLHYVHDSVVEKWKEYFESELRLSVCNTRTTPKGSVTRNGRSSRTNGFVRSWLHYRSRSIGFYNSCVWIPDPWVRMFRAVRYITLSPEFRTRLRGARARLDLITCSIRLRCSGSCIRLKITRNVATVRHHILILR